MVLHLLIRNSWFEAREVGTSWSIRRTWKPRFHFKTTQLETNFFYVATLLWLIVISMPVFVTSAGEKSVQTMGLLSCSPSIINALSSIYKAAKETAIAMASLQGCFRWAFYTSHCICSRKTFSVSAPTVWISSRSLILALRGATPPTHPSKSCLALLSLSPPRS